MAMRYMATAIIMMASAVPASATNMASAHQDFASALGLARAPSGAERLYPQSPIGKDGWRSLGAIVRIEADRSIVKPDLRQHAVVENSAG